MVGYHLEGPRPKERKAKGQTMVMTSTGFLTPQTSIDSEHAESTQELTPEKDTRTPLSSSQPLSISTSSCSSLASSLPSIATMLSSPVKTNLSPPLLSPNPPDGLLPLSSLGSTKEGITLNARHHIPRLASGQPEDPSLRVPVSSGQPVTPHLWSVFDVCQFLRINDCAAHCDSFRKKSIDGPALLALSKEQIVNFIGMKMGPSLKIFDLIQALRSAASSSSSASASSRLPTSKPDSSPSPQTKHSSALQAHLLS
ncbi:hypothetical protein CAPTEDRAFT_222398 [Capitella teleta]|uniref:SAM domain-containing protein n=1 Tax=Capitella teleta TaxID=283909 RepID=R7T7B3_CAPTE|nr:hypothetical protein CAPTEDRAFT_222398 [Capitella teleta]|eukprot:ELT89485.1 hypothetical protein CAPTEDRAFT_222398 [Capitella teleta]